MWLVYLKCSKRFLNHTQLSQFFSIPLHFPPTPLLWPFRINSLLSPHPRVPLTLAAKWSCLSHRVVSHTPLLWTHSACSDGNRTSQVQVETDSLTFMSGNIYVILKLFTLYFMNACTTVLHVYCPHHKTQIKLP